MNILTPLDQPYRDAVERFFVREFPLLNCGDANSTLEYLTSAFISTSQVRYGSAPGPESLVAIRRVIRLAMEAGGPIPVLTLYGGRKSRLEGKLDIAEVSSLKTLAGLQERVTARYAPGVQIKMRIEDASAHYLFADEGQASRDSVVEYTATLEKLIRILRLGFLEPMPERLLFDEKAFTEASDSIVPALLRYLADTDAYGFDGYEARESWRELSAMGWRGRIPAEQRDYYRGRYAANYPGITPADATMKLARYFAQSWARYQFHALGTNPEWGNDFVRVSFVPPVPGAPFELTSTTLHYRTVPTRFARTHIPPWRAKGFLEIGETEAIPKITNWSDPTPMDTWTLALTDGKESADIQIHVATV